MAAQIRLMREDDLQTILLVERAAYQFPWTPGVFRDCLRVGYCCWVIVIGGEVVGHGIMSAAAGEAHILHLCIAPNVQGMGLGRSLLMHLLRVAREHQAYEIFLEVRPSNHIASALYANAGFAAVGFRKDYYPGHGGREDAIVMSLSILK
ncbi:MAG: ribosomal-protein-alanine N-acetyltransferase [Gammaproteobacteria bacterium]|nr:ribosomal-protein-alanine N-acetyltransferase [Gammaproteobacteria bacterium]